MFTASTLSHSSCPTQRMLRALLECPALFTRMSARPYWATVHSARPRASAAFSTSQARATARPPARVISPTTSSSGALRRPATTTRAPSAASISAAARPMPVPPPVMIATCPSRTPMRLLPPGPPGASAPGPHGLLEVVHARGPSVDDHLAHLVDDGRGGRVDQGAQQRELDHRAIALRDADQARDVRALEVLERHPEDLGHLGRVRDELAHEAAPHHHRGDDEAGARAVVVQRAQHGALVEDEADLLLQLAQRRPLRGLARVEAAARQGPLAGVLAQRRGPAGDEEAGAPFPVV